MAWCQVTWVYHSAILGYFYSPLEPVQLYHKFLIYQINMIIPLFLAVGLWILHCSMKSCRLSIRTLCSCILPMDQHAFLQYFQYIISLASLACTFTTLYMIQYSMRDHNNNNNNTSTGPQNHDLIDLSASASNYDTPDTTSISKNTEKTNSWWTENEINLLLDYIEANCILTTAWDTNMKKSKFNKTWAIVKSKNATQCHYKWGHVSFYVIDENSYHLSSIIAIYHIQSNFTSGTRSQKVGGMMTMMPTLEPQAKNRCLKSFWKHLR